MKVLLATTMALGVILTLSANQPVNAAVIQPSVAVSHQNQLTPVYYRRYYYGPGPGYYYEPGPFYYGNPAPLVCVLGLCI
jgi:hypothetical protein